MLYGQPEKIIMSIKNRLRIFPKVDENSLQTLSNFAIEIHNLVAVINACHLADELNNSTLLFEIIQKLPASYQMQWAIIKNQLKSQNVKTNLIEFDKWIFNIGITASTLVIDSNKSSNSSTSYKKLYFNTHYDRKCFACQEIECLSVASCSKFQNLSRNDKWSLENFAKFVWVNMRANVRRRDAM